MFRRRASARTTIVLLVALIGTSLPWGDSWLAPIAPRPVAAAAWWSGTLSWTNAQWASPFYTLSAPSPVFPANTTVWFRATVADTHTYNTIATPGDSSGFANNGYPKFGDEGPLCDPGGGAPGTKTASCSGSFVVPDAAHGGNRTWPMRLQCETWRYADQACTVTWEFSLTPLLPIEAAPPGTEQNENTETAGDPVQTFSGALQFDHTDVAIEGRGPYPTLRRSYSSADTRVGRLGPGWTDNYSARLRSPADLTGDILVVNPDGDTDRYAANPDGTFAPPPATYASLIRNGNGTYTVTHRDQSRWTFSSLGDLTSIADRYGNTSTLTYNGSGQLTAVSDPAGRGSLTLAYTSGRLTSVTDWASPARTLTYQYDGSGRLWKVTDREGKTTTYGYDGTTHRIATITNARGKVVLTSTYDAQGRVATQKDARGVQTGDVTTFGYVVNPDGTRETTTTAPVTSFEPSFSPTIEDRYDANGWLVERVTRPSSTETYTQAATYDADGNRTSVTDQRGNRTDFCYDVSYAGAPISGSRGNLTRVIGPAPLAGADRPVTLNLFDASDNVIQTVSPKGVPSGSTASCETDLSSTSTAFATDFTFDPTRVFLVARTTRFTDPDLGLRTATTKYEYDDPANPGLVTRSIPPRGNTGPNPDYTYATTSTYFTTGVRAGMLKDVTDPLGDTVSYDYDAVGRLTSTIDALGNAAGGVPADHRTDYVFDNEDRVRFVKLPAPTAGGGQLVTETRYDEVGNPIVSIDAAGQVTTYSYDDRNSLFQVRESPLAWTDPANPPAQVVTTEYTRDATSNPTRITRAKGDALYERVLDYVYDGRGLPRFEKQYPSWPSTAGVLTMAFEYDGAGNPTSLVDPAGRTMTAGYDALNRRTSLGYSDPATADVTFAYDANGNRTQMVDGTGTTTYTVDEADRPVTVTSPGSSAVGYRYDLDGNGTKLIYPDASAVNYVFDRAGRMASLSDWASRSVAYTYWPDGLVKTETYPDLSVASLEYDNARRLVDVTDRRSDGAVITQSSYTLDANGNVLTEQSGSVAPQFARPDGLAGSSGTWTGTFASINEPTANDATFLASPASPTTSHFYEVSLSDVELPGDPIGVVLRYRYAKNGNDSGKTTNLVVELRQGTTVIASQTHTNIPGVDGSGWQQGTITLTTGQAATITNGADLRIRFRPSSSGGGQGRSAQVSWAELQLPGPGHLATNAYDQLNRLTSVTEQSVTRSYTYDSVGNRLTRVDGATTTYTYDRADRMTAAGAAPVTVDANGNLTVKGGDTFAFDQANRLTAATVGGVTETYGYDGNGTRVSRQVGGGPLTQLRSDTSGPLAVTLDDGSRKYVYGQGLAYAVSGSTLEIYHDDRLGSTRALTDQAGVTTATYDSDEWGRPTGGSGGSIQPYRFTGEPTDASGLTYLRTRYYDPDLGRFLTRDMWPGVPSQPQTQNRYAYVGNNPTTLTDPSGRFLDTLVDAAFIIFDVGALVFGPEKERDDNLLALGADVAGLALPFFTGGGAAVRAAATHLDDAEGPIKFLDEAAGACSFTGETLVATPDGPVPISSIEVGDIVLAWDQVTGDVVERAVVAVVPHTDDEVGHLTIDGAVVITTPDHLFRSDRGWVEAGALRLGSKVQRLDGSFGTVEGFRTEIGSVVMWDLTVADVHTFGVGEGQWVVHNLCGVNPPKPPKPGSPPPGEGWVWRGNGPEGSPQGNWIRPGTKEYVHWDPNEKTWGPHWDWRDPLGNEWRIFPDGSVRLK